MGKVGKPNVPSPTPGSSGTTSLPEVGTPGIPGTTVARGSSVEPGSEPGAPGIGRTGIMPDSEGLSGNPGRMFVSPPVNPVGNVSKSPSFGRPGTTGTPGIWGIIGDSSGIPGTWGTTGDSPGVPGTWGIAGDSSGAPGIWGTPGTWGITGDSPGVPGTPGTAGDSSGMPGICGAPGTWGSPSGAVGAWGIVGA